jgi:hypothetical protein
MQLAYVDNFMCHTKRKMLLGLCISNRCTERSVSVTKKVKRCEIWTIYSIYYGNEGASSSAGDADHYVNIRK